MDATLTTWATFQINNAKLYAPVFTISWNKLRSEIATQPKNNNLDYLINPIFKNINRLIVLNDDPTRDIRCH